MEKNIINNIDFHNLPEDEYRKENRILSLNENIYGCSKKVKKVLKKIINVSEYPDDNCTKLRKKISELVNIDANRIIVGNGSGELLQIISRTYIEDGDEVITCVPTYPYYFVETIIEKGKLISVPLKNFKFDIDGILNAITDKTKLIYITNPNNPTGTIITEEEQNKLINNVRKDILIIFDEAYYEYVSSNDFPNTINDVKKYDNVCLLRTFSKAYGLASMRIGYLIGSNKTIECLNKVRLTFNVSQLSQMTAIAALEDQDFIKKCKSKNNKMKNYLYSCLDNLKIKYVVSETNFVFIEVNTDIINNIKNKKISVKSYNFNDKKYIRLSLGVKKDIKKIIKIINETINGK